MPKKVKKILIPSKGMNNYADSRDLPDSHFEELQNADLNVPGKIKTGARFFPGPSLNKHGQTGEADELPSVLPAGSGGVNNRYNTRWAQVSRIETNTDEDKVALEVLGSPTQGYALWQLKPTGLSESFIGWQCPDEGDAPPWFPRVFGKNADSAGNALWPETTAQHETVYQPYNPAGPPYPTTVKVLSLEGISWNEKTDGLAPNANKPQFNDYKPTTTTFVYGNHTTNFGSLNSDVSNAAHCVVGTGTGKIEFKTTTDSWFKISGATDLRTWFDDSGGGTNTFAIKANTYYTLELDGVNVSDTDGHIAVEIGGRRSHHRIEKTSSNNQHKTPVDGLSKHSFSVKTTSSPTQEIKVYSYDLDCTISGVKLMSHKLDGSLIPSRTNVKGEHVNSEEEDCFWGIVVDRPAFMPDMAGGYVHGVGGSNNAYTSFDSSWRTNSAKILRVDSPYQAVISNKIEIGDDNPVYIDWSPAYNQMRGQNSYKVRIEKVDTTNHKVTFKVARNNESVYQVEHTYKMNSPDYHWECPWLQQVYNNPNMSSYGANGSLVMQSLRDAVVEGIEIKGGYKAYKNGISNDAFSRGADIPTGFHSDWYRIDYGVYIRWYNHHGSADFDNVVKEGDYWFFQTDAPINLSTPGNPTEYFEHSPGGEHMGRLYGRRRLRTNFKSDSYGGRLHEFTGNYLFNLQSGQNVNQVALEYRGDVYVYSSESHQVGIDTYGTAGTKTIELQHGWLHLGKCIYENQEVTLYKQGQDTTEGVYDTVRFKHYPINRQSLRLWLVKANGEKKLIPYGFGRTDLRTGCHFQAAPFENPISGRAMRYAFKAGISTTEYEEQYIANGMEPVAAGASSGVQFGDFTRNGDPGFEFNHQTGEIKFCHDAQITTHEQTAAAAVGTSLMMPHGSRIIATADSEISYSADSSAISFLNGKLRVSSRMWPFNGKAWWVGEGKGLKPHVYADFSHGVTNTPIHGNDHDQVSNTIKAWEPSSKLNMQEIAKGGHAEGEYKQVTQFSQWGIQERPAVIPKPNEATSDGKRMGFASIPNDWNGMIYAHYGHARVFSDDGAPYFFPFYGRADQQVGGDSNVFGNGSHPAAQHADTDFMDDNILYPRFMLPRDAAWDTDAEYDDIGSNDNRKHSKIQRYLYHCKQAMMWHKANKNWMQDANACAEAGNPYVLVVAPTLVFADEADYTDTSNELSYNNGITYIKEKGAGFKSAVSDLARRPDGSSGNALITDNFRRYWDGSRSGMNTYHGTNVGTQYCGIEGVSQNAVTEGSPEDDWLRYGATKAHYIRIERVMPDSTQYTFDTTQALNNLYGAQTTWYGDYPEAHNADSKAIDEGDAEDTDNTGQSSHEFNLLAPTGVDGYTILVPVKEDMYDTAGNRVLLGRSSQSGNSGSADDHGACPYEYKILPPRGGSVLIQHHGLGVDGYNVQWATNAMAKNQGTEGCRDITSEKLSPTIYWKQQETYEFGITYSDSDENESELYTHENTRIWLGEHEQFRPGLTLHGPFPRWLRKIRIYIRVAGGSDDAWALFLETDLATVYGYKDADLKQGSKLITIGKQIYQQGNVLFPACGYNSDKQTKGLLSKNNSVTKARVDFRKYYRSEIAFTDWGIKINKMNAVTYRLLNGFKPSPLGRITGYNKYALVNGIFIVADIRYSGTATNDDTLYWSPKFRKPRYDNLHIESAINLNLTDGDSITDLKAHKGKLLVFKKRTIEVVDFSDVRNVRSLETLNQGINIKGGAIETDFGVVWANKDGVYLYGDKGLRNISMGKLNSIWLKDFMESNLDSMSYKSHRNPYSILYYDEGTQDVLIIPDGSYTGSGGKAILKYNLLMGAFTYTPKGFENCYYLGDRIPIQKFDNVSAAAQQNSNIKSLMYPEDGDASTLIHNHTREFYGGTLGHYWHDDDWTCFTPSLKGHTGEMRVLTDNVIDVEYSTFNTLQNPVASGYLALETGETYSATDEDIKVTSLESRSMLMVGDYFVIRSAATDGSKELPHAKMCNDLSSYSGSTHREEILQVRELIYGDSGFDTVRATRGALHTVPSVFATDGGGDDIPSPRIFKLQGSPVSGAFMTYNSANRLEIGDRNLLWATPDMHMSADFEATAQGQRGEATKKRFYKLIATYRNNIATDAGGNTNSQIKCYFAVDGKEMSYTSDYEMLLKDGTAPFNSPAKDWITQELYPKDKTKCKNNFTIRYHFISEALSPYKHADGVFGSKDSVYTSVGDYSRDGSRGEIVRGSSFKDSENKSISSAQDLDTMTITGLWMRVNNNTTAAWQSNSNVGTEFGNFRVGFFNHAWPDNCIVLKNNIYGTRASVFQIMSDNTPHASTPRCRNVMKQGKTYRIEVWYINDRDNAILQVANTDDVNEETFPYYVAKGYPAKVDNLTAVGSNTRGGNFDSIVDEIRNTNATNTGNNFRHTMQSKSVPGEVRISDSSDFNTIGGDEVARWKLRETGKYHWYYTVPKTNKEWDAGIYLWLTTGSDEPHGYAVFSKISIREVTNYTAGGFEVNDITQIYREKSVK